MSSPVTVTGLSLSPTDRPPRPVPGFDRFPPEVRYQIFGYCIEWAGKTPPLIKALRPEKTFHAEAMYLLSKHERYTLSIRNKFSFGEMSPETIGTIQNLGYEAYRDEDDDRYIHALSGHASSILFPKIQSSPLSRTLRPALSITNIHIKNLRASSNNNDNGLHHALCGLVGKQMIHLTTIVMISEYRGPRVSEHLEACYDKYRVAKSLAYGESVLEGARGRVASKEIVRLTKEESDAQEAEDEENEGEEGDDLPPMASVSFAEWDRLYEERRERFETFLERERAKKKEEIRVVIVWEAGKAEGARLSWKKEL